MPISPKRMPFFEHFGELRRRLAIIAAVILVGSVALYWEAPRIYTYFMAPILPYFGGTDLVLLGPFEGFTLRFKVALYATLMLGSPIIIWQVFGFFLPALRPKEQKWVIPTFAAMAVLFAAGAYVGHTYVLGTAFGWMVAQAWEGVQVLPDAGRYFQGAVLLVLGFGLSFQLPVVVFYLVLFEIVPYAKLRENWRIAYVTLLVFASVATPDWSPVSMGLMFGALLALYELSLLFARIVLSKRIARQAVLEE
ncbi:MAG: twin-arginine translocase subunit TatC [Actinobacteria bacterium]|nr:twin-arginine translocase subunit TatC [Actinomycetota bacterium]